MSTKMVQVGPYDGQISHTHVIGMQDTRAVHEPNRNVAASGVAPQNVAIAVTVEVARPSDLEAGGDISHARRVGIQDRGAVHFPNRNVAAGIVPQDIALAVAVEVAGSNDGPGGGHISDTRRIGI